MELGLKLAAEQLEFVLAKTLILGIELGPELIEALVNLRSNFFRCEHFDLWEDELTVLGGIEIEDWGRQREWSELVGEFDTGANIDALLLAI